MNKLSVQFQFFVALLITGLTGCGQTLGSTEVQSQSEAEIQLPSEEIYKPQALMWENEHPEGRYWSSLVYRMVSSPTAAALMDGSEDVEDFCPAFQSLNQNQKINFWGFLISALAKQESGFQPLARAADRERQTDPVTGRPMYREGLLQISYALKRENPFCSFDWPGDQRFTENDPRRSTLNPFSNLSCGVHVLADQITKHKRIAHNSSYWKSLKTNTPWSAVNEIQNATRNLSFCQLFP